MTLISEKILPWILYLKRKNRWKVQIYQSVSTSHSFIRRITYLINQKVFLENLIKSKEYRLDYFWQ